MTGFQRMNSAVTHLAAHDDTRQDQHDTDNQGTHRGQRRYGTGGDGGVPDPSNAR